MTQSGSVHLEKEMLFKQIEPLFPRFDSLLNKLPYPEGHGWDEFTQRNRTFHEKYMLPYWLSLAPAYAQALACSFGSDNVQLDTCIEDWSDTFKKQQTSLYQLLQTSKLRMAWRGYCQWTSTQQTLYTDGQRKIIAELDRELGASSAVLAEIPLYSGLMRTSCQQLICMPVAQWKNMYCSGARYEPGQVDIQTVNRLAMRVAQIFNAPPLAPLEFLRDRTGWESPIVWPASPRLLTCSISLHGMRDRMEDEYGNRRYDADKIPCQDFRFEGFCGQIRVVLEDGTPWYVTILAPTHFLRELIRYPRFYDRS